MLRIAESIREPSTESLQKNATVSQDSFNESESSKTPLTAV